MVSNGLQMGTRREMATVRQGSYTYNTIKIWRKVNRKTLTKASIRGIEGGGPVRALPGPAQGVRHLGHVQVP